MPRAGEQVELRAALAITTGYVASSAFAAVDFENLSLYITYLNNGALNNLQYYAEYSADKTNWYRDTHTEVNATTGAGIATMQVDTFVAVAAPAASDLIKVPFKCPDNYIRFMIKETVAAGTAGVVTLDAAGSLASGEDLGKNVI